VFGIGIGVAEELGAVDADAMAVGDAGTVAAGALLGDGDALGPLEAGGVQAVSRKSSAATTSDRGIWNMCPVCEASVSPRQRFGPQGVQLR
jgi:hypothetical protein